MSTPQPDRRAIIEKLYEFAGRLLAVRIADEESAADIIEFFRGFQFTKTPQPTARAAGSCVIEFQKGTPPPLPHGLQTFKVPHGHCLTDWKSYFLAVDDSRVDILPPSRARVSVWLGDTPRARHPVALANVICYAVQAALRRCQLYDFHAACLAEPTTGSGFLFAGPPNSGKSTLTVRLVMSGWQYLTDDMVVLDATAEGVSARGLRRSFAVTSEALEGFDLPRLDEALGTTIPSDPRKRFLNPKLVFPGGRVTSCRPRVLCFPQITGEASSRVEPLGHREAMSLLIKYNPWAGYDMNAARDHLRALGRLVSQTRTLRLLAGDDMLRDAGRAAELLAPYAAGPTP
jgi:hypothetical protein